MPSRTKIDLSTKKGRRKSKKRTRKLAQKMMNEDIQKRKQERLKRKAETKARMEEERKVKKEEEPKIKVEPKIKKEEERKIKKEEEEENEADQSNDSNEEENIDTEVDNVDETENDDGDNQTENDNEIENDDGDNQTENDDDNQIENEVTDYQTGDEDENEDDPQFDKVFAVDTNPDPTLLTDDSNQEKDSDPTLAKHAKYVLKNTDANSQVYKAVIALINLLEEKRKNKEKNDLFEPDDNIHMIVTIPKILKRSKMLSIDLPYPFLGKKARICYICKNNKDKKIVKGYIEKYTVPIDEVLPYEELRHYAPDQVNKLAKSFDLFLCDYRINKVLRRPFGKHFSKIWFPVRTGQQGQLLKKYTLMARNSTFFNIPPGTCMSLKVGTIDQGVDRLVMNIKVAAKGVSKRLKLHKKQLGGVKSISIKGDDTIAFPIFNRLPEIDSIPKQPKLRKRDRIAKMNKDLRVRREKRAEKWEEMQRKFADIEALRPLNRMEKSERRRLAKSLKRDRKALKKQEELAINKANRPKKNKDKYDPEKRKLMKKNQYRGRGQLRSIT